MVRTRVFLLEPTSRYDIVKCGIEEYGDVVYFSDQTLSPFNVDGIRGKVESGIKQHHFNCENDYVCLSGNGQSVAIMIAMLAANFAKLNVLVFDSRSSRYRARVVHTRTGVPHGV